VKCYSPGDTFGGPSCPGLNFFPTVFTLYVVIHASCSFCNGGFCSPQPDGCFDLNPVFRNVFRDLRSVYLRFPTFSFMHFFLRVLFLFSGCWVLCGVFFLVCLIFMFEEFACRGPLFKCIARFFFRVTFLDFLRWRPLLCLFSFFR